jgi:hypothetical protein
MTKAKKLVLPKEWRTFANRYGADRAYWYVLKGLAVSTDSLKPRLQVLKEFEGGSKPWREPQQQYVQRLNEEKISNAGAEWPEGGAPLARTLKKVFGSVGLAWVDPDEHVEITPAGAAFDDKLKTARDARRESLRDRWRCGVGSWRYDYPIRVPVESQRGTALNQSYALQLIRSFPRNLSPRRRGAEIQNTLARILWFAALGPRFRGDERTT